MARSQWIDINLYELRHHSAAYSKWVSQVVCLARAHDKSSSETDSSSNMSRFFPSPSVKLINQNVVACASTARTGTYANATNICNHLRAQRFEWSRIRVDLRCIFVMKLHEINWFLPLWAGSNWHAASPITHSRRKYRVLSFKQLILLLWWLAGLWWWLIFLLLFQQLVLDIEKCFGRNI